MASNRKAVMRRWRERRAERCESCGRGFRRDDHDRHSFGNGDRRVYHGPCIAFVIWRNRAEERLRVLGLVAELAGLDGRRFGFDRDDLPSDGVFTAGPEEG